MRIDVVTIFPAFFDVLEVSLIGKARERGLFRDAYLDRLLDRLSDISRKAG